MPLPSRRTSKNDTNLFCFIEDDANNVLRQPPTKLKNPKIFRPFEMYVKMYGLPNYNEIDPTIIVGLTYAFIFGIMFADVGQGIMSADWRRTAVPLQEDGSGSDHEYLRGILCDLRILVRSAYFGFENVIRPSGCIRRKR